MPEPTTTTPKSSAAVTEVKEDPKATQIQAKTAQPKTDTASETEELDPAKIEYAKTENAGQEDLDNGLTQITYKLSEPKGEVDDKYKTQTHVVKLNGKKRVSYDMYAGDGVKEDNHIGSLDVSATG